MYTLTDEHEKEIQSWINKLDDSIVKSNIINLFAEVWPTNRLTSEQLEKFLSFQNALPKEFQSYPQVVAQWLKNQPSKKAEKVLEQSAPPIDFKSMVADSHAHIKSASKSEDKGEQKQEILHTLGVTDKKKAGTKAVPKLTIEEPTYEQELKTEAAKSAKISHGKPAAQKKEEESIIARNKNVSDGGKATSAQKAREEKSILARNRKVAPVIKAKQKVVVVNKASAKKVIGKTAKSRR